MCDTECDPANRPLSDACKRMEIPAVADILSQRHQRKHGLSTSCLDFLMIELVPMTYRVANELDTSAAADGSAEHKNNAAETASNAATATTTAAGGSRKLDEDEERDAVFFRLEGLGYRVGLGLVERYELF